MAEQEFYSKFLSHWDDDNDLNRAEAGSGEDEHPINIPSGRRFSRVQLDIQAQTMFSAASISQSPSAGATGKQKIKVRWAFNPFGKIAYTVRAFAVEEAATAPEPLVITVGEANWSQRALDGIRQKIPMTLQLRGPDAKTFNDALQRATQPNRSAQGIMLFANVTVGTIVAVVAILAVVAIVALIVICVICLVAISAGYRVDIESRRTGPLPYNEELKIKLNPPK